MFKVKSSVKLHTRQKNSFIAAKETGGNGRENCNHAQNLLFGRNLWCLMSVSAVPKGLKMSNCKFKGLNQKRNVKRIKEL